MDTILPQEQWGYHTRTIARGILGEPSKIREEFEEFMDAINQDAKIMALIELSDLIGAIDAYLKQHEPGTEISDLIRMAEITQRAFRNGHRD